MQGSLAGLCSNMCKGGGHLFGRNFIQKVNITLYFLNIKCYYNIFKFPLHLNNSNLQEQGHPRRLKGTVKPKLFRIPDESGTF